VASCKAISPCYINLVITPSYDFLLSNDVIKKELEQRCEKEGTFENNDRELSHPQKTAR